MKTSVKPTQLAIPAGFLSAVKRFWVDKTAFCFPCGVYVCFCGCGGF
jgi:hypothetical protein